MIEVQKILVAEDELLVAKVMKLALEKKGYLVKHVVEEQEVVREALEFCPDLIVMDIYLKNKSSGIKAGIALREKQITTPIIFTTGNSLDQTRVEIRPINNSYLFIKPIDLDQLIAYIQKGLVHQQ